MKNKKSMFWLLLMFVYGVAGLFVCDALNVLPTYLAVLFGVGIMSSYMTALLVADK